MRRKVLRSQELPAAVCLRWSPSSAERCTWLRHVHGGPPSKLLAPGAAVTAPRPRSSLAIFKFGGPSAQAAVLWSPQGLPR